MDYLLWDLPLKVGLQFFHAEIIKQGGKTIRADASVSNTVKQMERWIAKRREQSN